MSKQTKTVAASRAEASLYLGKAEQFLEAALGALQAHRQDAGMLNAIHAALRAQSELLSGPVRRSGEPSSSQQWLSNRDFFPVLGPAGVERTVLVDPLVGVRPEIVAQALHQVRRKAFAPVGVVISQR